MELETGVRNAMNDARVDLIDVGAGTAVLQLRTGSAPAIGSASGGTLLAEFDLPNPAFGASAAGSATANAISAVVGEGDGTVGHYDVKDRNGLSRWRSNDVGTSGTSLVLNTTTISTGVDVSVTSWTSAQPAGTA